MWLGFGLNLAERCKGHPLVSHLSDMPRREDGALSSGGPDERELPRRRRHRRVTVETGPRGPVCVRVALGALMMTSHNGERT